MARRPKTNFQENAMARALDQRVLYEGISAQIAPILTQALAEGWSDEKLANHPKIQLLLTARTITEAINNPDAAKAMTAIKDLKDRTQGKPKERVELTSKLEKTPDEQLDAMIKTRLGLDSETDDETIN
jgi:hypothetical protein